METSLHRQLKEMYAGCDAQLEVPVDGYRIDAVCDEQLIEIQLGSLAAIRDKIARLLKRHQVLVVKPIVARKRLVKQDKKGGKVLSRRLSPKRGNLIDVFDELIYFTQVFPHENLILDIVLVEVEELRYPGHGRRRRRRANDFRVEDQRLLEVHQTQRLRSAADLVNLVPGSLPTPFHTGDLAKSLNIKRHIAQRIAYCYREMNITQQVGKQGNAILYQFNDNGADGVSGAA